MSSVMRAVRKASVLSRLQRGQATTRTAAFSTQSGDDAKKPTALARLHLEDGTTLTGTSFGCHTSVEGEVRIFLIRVSEFSRNLLDTQRISGRLRHWNGGIPRELDRSLLPGTDSLPDDSYGRKLWCSRSQGLGRIRSAGTF